MNLIRKWRVGTLTMGLLLLATGIIMLISLVMEINAVKLIMTFWPIVLILLGIEILLHLFARKNADNADEKTRYDVLSILFIGILLCMSLGFYALTYVSGFFESRSDFFESFGIMNEDVVIEDAVTLEGSRELVVLGDIAHITVMRSSDDNMKVDYTVAANTNDREYAETALPGVVKIDKAERAYLHFNTTLINSTHKLSWPSVSCVVYLPAEAKLDLRQFNGACDYDPLLEAQITHREPETYDPNTEYGMYSEGEYGQYPPEAIPEAGNGQSEVYMD